MASAACSRDYVSWPTRIEAPDMRIRHILDSGQLPVIAILRGLRPVEAVSIGEALLAGGIRIMEVPFNSPEPLASIERLAGEFGARALIGAGTVLTAAPVESVVSAGGAARRLSSYVLQKFLSDMKTWCIKPSSFRRPPFCAPQGIHEYPESQHVLAGLRLRGLRRRNPGVARRKAPSWCWLSRRIAPTGEDSRSPLRRNSETA